MRNPKKISMFLLSSSLLLATTLLTFSACEDDAAPTKPIVDLKAMSISYELVSKTTPTTGFIKVIGIVKNIGEVDFVSNPGQSVAQILMSIPGVPGDVVKTSKEITLFAVGEEYILEYKMPWNVTNEFQPQFTLNIGYDPDIFIDGNPKNDEINLTNNILKLDGTLINSLFP